MIVFYVTFSLEENVVISPPALQQTHLTAVVVKDLEVLLNLQLIKKRGYYGGGKRREKKGFISPGTYLLGLSGVCLIIQCRTPNLRITSLSYLEEEVGE